MFSVVGTTDQDQIRQAKIGDKTVTYKKLADPLTLMTSTAVGRKVSMSTTNSQTTWVIRTGMYAETYSTSRQYEQQRQDPNFAQNTIIKKDVFFEDEFDSAANVTGVRIVGCAYYPMGGGDSSASTAGWRDTNIKAAFTQLVPNAGESKDAFRARIKSQELQYGFYEEGGKTIFMAYLGNFPNDNLKWVDPQGRWNAEADIDSTVASGAYPVATQERADLWKAAHAADNLINGDITEVQFRLDAQYPTVIKETVEENTVTVEHDGVAERRTGTATFRPNIAVATPAHDAVTLVKFDEENNSVLQGATFKLQRKDAQGQWQDYTPNDGSAATATTGDSGTVSFSGLVNGEYRFVETSAVDGYDASTLKLYSDAGDTEITDEVHFTINAGDAAGPILYASNKKGVETKYGSLTVSKKVDGNAADATKAFNFTVTLKDADGAALAETEVGDVTTDANGKITFALKGGESKTITDIPEGSTYEVTETEVNQDGYTTTSEGATGTIAADATATASFTNTKNYTPVKVDPPVTKVVEGTEDKDAFTYTLAAVSGPNDMAAADMPMPAGAQGASYSITKEGAGSYEFGEFELAVPGTYVYQITEEAGSLDYDYDDSTYTVTYVVAAGADGKTLEAETTIVKDGEAAEDVVFTNVKKTDTTEDPKGDDPEPAKTPLLSITKTTDVKNVQVGDVVPYTITITNSGEGDATGVEIVDALPEGLTYVSDDSNGAVDGQNVTWTVDVAAGESVRIVINAQINENASGKVVNSASITPNVNVPTVPQKDVDEESVEIAKPDTSLTTGDGEDEGKDDGKDDAAKTPESKEDVKANPPAKQNTPAAASAPAATPKTADVASTALWLTLLALSGAGLAGAYRLRRREEDQTA